MLVTNSGPSRSAILPRQMHISLQAAILAGVAFAMPLLLLAALALTHRKHPWLLGLIYPGLKNFSRITYIMQVVLGLLWLFGQSGLKRPFWLALIFNSGIQLVRSWIRQRVSPDASEIKLYEGWWPAKKDF